MQEDQVVESQDTLTKAEEPAAGSAAELVVSQPPAEPSVSVEGPTENHSSPLAVAAHLTQAVDLDQTNNGPAVKQQEVIANQQALESTAAEPDPLKHAQQAAQTVIGIRETEREHSQTGEAPYITTAAAHVQQEMPFAIVEGRPVTELPTDLYIPPDALEIILDAFEGPLDLLLYLIKRQNLDILQINVADIAHQYIAYVEMIQRMRFELAAEYLLMAAMLAEIKSRMLLPRQASEEEEEELDPRAELIRRLQEYERFKQAAEQLDELPRTGRDLYTADTQQPRMKANQSFPDIDMRELMLAFGAVLKRADLFEKHQVQVEKLSTRERMSDILQRLQARQYMAFTDLFTLEEGRLGVVVTFLAVLELIKEAMVEIVQQQAFAPLHVKSRS